MTDRYNHLVNIELGRRLGPPLCYFAAAHGHNVTRVPKTGGRTKLTRLEKKQDRVLYNGTIPAETRLMCMLGPGWPRTTWAELVFPGSPAVYSWVCIDNATFTGYWSTWLHEACPLTDDLAELAPLLDAIQIGMSTGPTLDEMRSKDGVAKYVARQHPLYPNYESHNLDAVPVSLGTVLRELHRITGDGPDPLPGTSTWPAPWEAEFSCIYCGYRLVVANDAPHSPPLDWPPLCPQCDQHGKTVIVPMERMTSS